MEQFIFTERCMFVIEIFIGETFQRGDAQFAIISNERSPNGCIFLVAVDQVRTPLVGAQHKIVGIAVETDIIAVHFHFFDDG